MRKNSISFVISFSQAGLTKWSAEEQHAKLLQLKSELENLEVEVHYLQAVAHLVVRTDQDTWHAVNQTIAILQGDNFDLQPNQLL